MGSPGRGRRDCPDGRTCRSRFCGHESGDYRHAPLAFETVPLSDERTAARRLGTERTPYDFRRVPAEWCASTVVTSRQPPAEWCRMPRDVRSGTSRLSTPSSPPDSFDDVTIEGDRAAMRWSTRNVRHVCVGRVRRSGRYRETVRSRRRVRVSATRRGSAECPRAGSPWPYAESALEAVRRYMACPVAAAVGGSSIHGALHDATGRPSPAGPVPSASFHRGHHHRRRKTDASVQPRRFAT